MEVEDRWKWKRDRSTANCKKSVQSCNVIINLAVKGVFLDISHLPDKVKKLGLVHRDNVLLRLFNI